MGKINEAMKKKGAGSTKQDVIIVPLRSRKEIIPIGVVTKKLQKKLPTLAVLSTLVVPMSGNGRLQEIKDSEPKLFHDK